MRLVCWIIFLTGGGSGSALVGNIRGPILRSSKLGNRWVMRTVPHARDASTFKALADLRAHEVDILMESIISDHTGECPPNDIPLKSGAVIRINKDHPNFHGSGSDLFISPSKIGDQQVIVKYINRADAETIKDLQDDYAFMHVIKGQGVIPKVYDVDEERMSPQCSIRVIVSDFVGMEPIKKLKELLYGQNPKFVARTILLVAARALEILQVIHSHGMIHGDIHAKNFAFDGDLETAHTTLYLLDFGRAEPFVDEAGEHIPEDAVDYGSKWNMRLLSPWELEHKRKSRRDDLFRLAETMFRCGNYDGAFESIADRIKAALKTGELRREVAVDFYLQMKEDRPLSSDPPQVLIDFYNYSLDLGFAQEPNYTYWIQLFRETAERII